jgi:hypothetical protein
MEISMNRVRPVWLRLGFLSVGIMFIIVYEWTTETTAGGSHLLDHIIFLLVLACLEQVVEMNLARDAEIGDSGQIDQLVRDGHIAEGVGRIANEVKDRFKLDAGKYVVRHSNLAIWSYYHFWLWLVREQMMRRAGHPLNLYVIHSNSMDPWRGHEYTNQLYMQHYLFTKAGGHITRILCADGAEASPDVKEVAKRFSAVGVTVRYYDTSKRALAFSFAFDFLWVRETNDIVIWANPIPGPGRGIEKAVYQRGTTFEGTSITDVWSDLDRNSKLLKFTPAELAGYAPDLDDGGPDLTP